jgi:signal transduction histidine kinase
MPDLDQEPGQDDAVAAQRTAPRLAAQPAALAPWALDLALVAIALSPPTLSLLFGPERGDTPVEAGYVVAGALIAIPLVIVRRRSAIGALAAAVVVSCALIAWSGQLTPVLGAVVVLIYTVASRRPRQTALVATGAAMVPLFVTVMLFEERAAFGPQGLAVVAWTCLACAVGDAVRNRRAYLHSLEERAQRAEQQREDDARRRVVEERLRIARDLHDVVAHRMAVINVQAGVAEHLLRADPDQAEAALREVRISASTVLTELGEMLHVLRRSDGGSGDDAPTQPAPGLADIDTLIATAAASGLQVDVDVQGDPSRVSEAAQLTAFRVIQESLTNAQRHGAGLAALRLRISDASIDIVVENQIGSTRTAAGSGLGLVGMRERVDAAGGLIDARSLVPGMFRVAVTLPASAMART